MTYPYGYVTEIYGYDYRAHDEAGYSITTRRIRLSGPVYDPAPLPSLEELDLDALLEAG